MKPLVWIAIIVLCLSGIATSWSLKKDFGSHVAGVADFMTFYVGAKLVGTPDLYNERAGWSVQESLVGTHSDIIPYLRLPFYAFVLKPITSFRYDQALRIWYGVLAASLVAFVLIWPGNKIAAGCALCSSVPVAANFFMGQDSIVLLVPLGLCLRLNQRGRTFGAGLALSVLLVKFHFLVFLPLLIVIQRRWRFGAGFGSGTLALLTLSFAVQGVRWPIAIIEALMRPSAQPSQRLMIDIRRVFLASPHALQFHIAGSILIALVVVAICARADFDLALAACLVAALLVNLHVYDQDYVLAIPFSCLLFERTINLLPLVFLFNWPLLFIWASAVIAIALALLLFVAAVAPVKAHWGWREPQFDG